MSKGKVVDLFCGAGGASLGFVKAGYEIVGAVDMDEAALNTYKKNLCDKDLSDYAGEVRFDQPLQADLSRDHEDDNVDGIPSVTFEDIRDEFDLIPEEVDVICGCPPCQNFSSLRDTEPWPSNKPKDNLLRAFVEFIEEEVPQSVFFENVENIMRAGDENPTTYVDWLIRSMEEIVRDGDSEETGGYGNELDVVNAADYGVPQRRKRAIGLFIYGEDDENISLPDPTHAENPDENSDLRRWKSVNDTIKKDDLKEGIGLGEEQVGLEGYPDDPAHRARRHQKRTVERMKVIRKEGGSWRDLIDTNHDEYIVDAHKGLERGADSAYGIMEGELPAPTLTTRCTTPSCGRFTHPNKNRAITYREAALLMTFPPEFELPDQNDSAERVIGNAVPPELVKTLTAGLR